jgi:hypothetical protein
MEALRFLANLAYSSPVFQSPQGPHIAPCAFPNAPRAPSPCLAVPVQAAHHHHVRLGDNTEGPSGTSCPHEEVWWRWWQGVSGCVHVCARTRAVLRFLHVGGGMSSRALLACSVWCFLLLVSALLSCWGVSHPWAVYDAHARASALFEARNSGWLCACNPGGGSKFTRTASLDSYVSGVKACAPAYAAGFSSIVAFKVCVCVCVCCVCLHPPPPGGGVALGALS